MPPNAASIPVVIAWHGLPAYAARQIRTTTATFGLALEVVGTPGVEPRAYIESLLGSKVTWIGSQKPVKWRDLKLASPAILFYTGWAYKAFNLLAAETRRNGGSSICMVDNSRKFTLRQAIAKWYFRLAIQPKIDEFLVPGAAATDLLNYFGVQESKIHQGLYGADPEVFSPGPPLSMRPNDFVFVGQFISRKGIDCMVAAAQILRRSGKQFSFAAIGQGPLRHALLDAGFRVEAFSTPEAVAGWLKKSRFLVLPSSEEHWGLVVHEAALSGCGLILSDAVGSRFEFSGPRNSWRFGTGNSGALAEAMSRALQMDDQRRAECHAQSLALAGRFGPDRWHESFLDILTLCLPAALGHPGANNLLADLHAK